MGYRSEVAVLVVANSKKEAETQSLFAEMMLQPFYSVVREDEGKGFRCYPRAIAYSFEHVKWYPEYADVKAFNEMWEWLDERSSDIISGMFLRIGEEDDDIERMSFGDDPPYDQLYLSRHLGFDFSMEESSSAAWEKALSQSVSLGESDPGDEQPEA